MFVILPDFGEFEARTRPASTVDLLAVLGWRLIDNPFEHPVEMRQGLKAHRVGDFADTEILIQQKIFRFLDPYAGR